MLREKHCIISLLMYGAITLAGCTQARQLVQRVNPETKHKVETMLTLARAHESEGELKEAEQQYRDILKLDPENGAACHRLGVVMMNQGEADEGLLYLEQANLLLPDDADVVADLGYAYMDAGQIEQAMPLLQAAYDKNPDDKRVINNLAQALGYSGKYDRSLAMFCQIMSEAEATANLAYIYTQTGNGPKAMELYSHALDLDPDLRWCNLPK